jgi:hypothetical protein
LLLLNCTATTARPPLGGLAGGMDYAAVRQAASRFGKRLQMTTDVKKSAAKNRTPIVKY